MRSVQTMRLIFISFVSLVSLFPLPFPGVFAFPFPFTASFALLRSPGVIDGENIIWVVSLTGDLRRGFKASWRWRGGRFHLEACSLGANRDARKGTHRRGEVIRAHKVRKFSHLDGPSRI